jgi:hypothetical protein
MPSTPTDSNSAADRAGETFREYLKLVAEDAATVDDRAEVIAQLRVVAATRLPEKDLNGTLTDR